MTVLMEFLDIRATLRDVLLGLAPLALLGLVFGLRSGLPRERLLSMLRGGGLVFAGLVLFLQGVKVGFLPAGRLLGQALGAPGRGWWLAPVGFALGLAVTAAEPAVRILGDQVERATRGSIRKRVIIAALSLGVGLAVALGLVRMHLALPIHAVIAPGYLLALAMLPFCDRIFTPIAFDSSTVATGPLVVSFVSAVGIGAAEAMTHTDPLLDGFGLVAVTALVPILCVLAAGCIHARKRRKTP